MKKFLLSLLAACMLLISPFVIQPTFASSDRPLFKRAHFNKADHAKVKTVKKIKPEFTKSKTHPDSNLQRFDKKKMHDGETRGYILGMPIKKKGYNPQ